MVGVPGVVGAYPGGAPCTGSGWYTVAVTVGIYCRMVTRRGPQSGFTAEWSLGGVPTPGLGKTPGRVEKLVKWSKMHEKVVKFTKITKISKISRKSGQNGLFHEIRLSNQDVQKRENHRLLQHCLSGQKPLFS